MIAPALVSLFFPLFACTRRSLAQRHIALK